MTDAEVTSGPAGAPENDEDPTGARPEDEVEMGFFEHLGELRTRLIRSVLGAIPTTALAWMFRQELLEALLEPWRQAWQKLGLDSPRIHYAAPADMFLVYLKNSAIAGLVLASPWVFYQLWGFVSPGLYRREKRMAVPFVLASTLCFVGGVSFGYYIVFPEAFRTLLEFAEQLPSGQVSIEPTVMITEYMSFVTRLLLGFGLVFEVPVVITTLSALNIVSARGLLSFGRWWLLVAGVISAFLTPPDVGSQLLMLFPLMLLYFISIGIAFAIERARGRSTDES